MKHIMKYRFKCMVRNRSLLFWTLAFPLILTTLFGAVLKDVFNSPVFETIDIGVIQNDAYKNDMTLQTLLKTTSNGEEKIFKLHMVNESEAKKLLKEGDITAYITAGKTLSVSFDNVGIEQTIVQSFFDEYLQKSEMVANMMAQGANSQQIQAIFQDTQSYIQTNATSNDDMSSVYFFTILAMNALFGGYWSIESMRILQGNQSDIAVRIAVSPMHKSKGLLCDFIVTNLIQMCFLIIILAHMRFIVNVSFGENYPAILLLLLVGAFAGNAFGTFIGCVNKKGMAMKSGMLTAITMVCSFLSGMMMIQVKYLVEVYAPWLAAINPVSMITDGLYALYYYGIGERFYTSLISLIIFTALGYILSYSILKKQQYESLGDQL